ncbi:MAG: HAMP domain-containing sensor histidine kinase [Ilumatobacteraceae bacterium]
MIALIAGTVTWWAVRRALRPVDSIRRTMSDITATDLHRRVPEWSARDEIGELAATVNSTLARLESSTEDQRRFVADASHELRGPLAALRADLEISVTHPDRTEWTEIAPELLRDVERLQELTDDLLFLALLDARRSPERGAVDLGPLVTEALESIRRPELQTRFDLATEHVTVVGDRRQLRRAISNLVANAERHARSTVAATLRAADGAVVLTIADDGAGIPAEDRERVFERFVRLDPARTRDDGGTGLGLAIVRDIVQLHGGEVSIGEHQPTGAIVTVHLPLAVASGYGRRRSAQ